MGPSSSSLFSLKIWFLWKVLVVLHLFLSSVEGYTLFAPHPWVFNSGSYISDLAADEYASPVNNSLNLQYQAESWGFARQSNFDPVYPVDRSRLIECLSLFGGDILTGTVITWKNYTGLVAHDFIHLSFWYLAVDRWEFEDSFTIEIDDGRLSFGPFHPNTPTVVPMIQICGDYGIPDTTGFVKIFFPNPNKSWVKVSIKMNVASYFSVENSTTALTFRHLTMIPTFRNPQTASEAPVPFYNQSMICHGVDCEISKQALIPGSFLTTCNLYQFYDQGTDSCQQCHIACEACQGPGIKNCERCKIGYTFDSYRQECVQCSSNCEQCRVILVHAPPHSIAICELCRFGYMLNMETGECVHQCPNPELVVAQMDLGERKCLPKCVVESESPFMLFNFTCIKTCPLPFKQRPGTMFCDFPCKREEYLMYDGTCSDSCSLFSWLEGPMRFCGTCPNKLHYVFPKNNTCSALCPDDGTSSFYKRETHVPSGTKLCLPRLKSSIRLIEQGPTALTDYTLEEFRVSANNNHNNTDENRFFEVNQVKYSIEQTWSFFSLAFHQDYQISQWDSAVNCGCHPQKCGIDCGYGVFCEASNFTNTGGEQSRFSCWNPFAMNTQPSYFCWNIYRQGFSEHKAFTVNLQSSVSLTNFSGPFLSEFDRLDFLKTAPGFSVPYRSQKQISNEPINARLSDLIVDLDSPLDLLYAESESRVVHKDDLQEIINYQPKNISIHLDQAHCGEGGRISLSRKIRHDQGRSSKTTKPQLEKTRETPTFYTIGLTASPSSTTTTKILLDEHYLLRFDGVLSKWHLPQQTKFSFIDPCNGVFLTLYQEANLGFYYVHPLPNIAHPLLEQDIICIAARDNNAFGNTNEKDLILLEIRNGTHHWKVSSRFNGLLSNDYVKAVKIRAVTSILNATTSLIPPNATYIRNYQNRLNHKKYGSEQGKRKILPEVSRNQDKQLFLDIMIDSPEPLDCSFYVSPSCSFRLNGTYILKSFDISSFCEEEGLYHTGMYNCREGFQGQFIIIADLPFNSSSSSSSDQINLVFGGEDSYLMSETRSFGIRHQLKFLADVFWNFSSSTAYWVKLNFYITFILFLCASKLFILMVGWAGRKFFQSKMTNGRIVKFDNMDNEEERRETQEIELIRANDSLLQTKRKSHQIKKNKKKERSVQENLEQ